jgi:rhodanese-related sulfurtransferase
VAVTCNFVGMHVPTVSITGVPDPLPTGLSVLDVREHVEWAYGHIDGAVHIPLGQLPSRMSDVPEGQLLVVCKIGGRSARAVAYLGHSGHDAVNLDGGMLDWEAAGRPIVSETGAPPKVV